MFRPAPPFNERVAYGPHPSTFFDLRFPIERRPLAVAIMIHGGFWRTRFDLAHAGHLCAALATAGLATANLEYRRVGEEGGGWPGTFDDVRTGIGAIRDRFPGLQTVVLGHSAGGHLALWAASEFPDLAGVVALGPVARLRSAWNLHLSDNAVAELLGGPPDLVSYRYDAACPTARPSAAPRILIHGLEDDVVPVSLSREFVAARNRDVGPVELVELADADHFDVIDPQSAAWPVVLDRVLSTIDRISAIVRSSSSSVV